MPVTREVEADGAFHVLTLERPPGNVIDSDLARELESTLSDAALDGTARLLVIRGAGDDFSWGASVEEHLPGHARRMLAALHGVVKGLRGFPYPTLATVRGRCLGGGLEVALACDFLLLEEEATLGTPEIRLGVFAPAATALLVDAVPHPVAAEILLAGRDVTAGEMVRWGLANRAVPPGTLDEAVEGFVEAFILPRSAASLRVAVQALRGGHGDDLTRRLEDLERMYLEELLPLEDGTEGIRAFMEKRQPQWSHR